MSTLMDDMQYTKDDLAANRAGNITARQADAMPSPLYRSEDMYRAYYVEAPHLPLLLSIEKVE